MFNFPVVTFDVFKWVPDKEMFYKRLYILLYTIEGAYVKMSYSQ